jgi:ion channel-forming bestrophin family protein
LYGFAGFTWIGLPWVPIALVGTAVAFLVGFKNNASYDRLWEGRKIWGAIVNASRTWGIMTRDFITLRLDESRTTEDELKLIHRRLINRHIAWLAALRFQLREKRNWEGIYHGSNKEFRKFFNVVEQEQDLDDELKKYLEPDELKYLENKKNRASQILSLQSKELKKLREMDLIEDFRHMEMVNVISKLYEYQGMSERIKNFPYPRQFATINSYFVWLFILLVPFGMVQEFEKMGPAFVWLTIPFGTLISWIFHTMERIGEATENPFEGGANDVPITSISRSIEIDLLQMLEEEQLPQNIDVQNNILM